MKKLWCSPHKPLPEQGEGFFMLGDVNPELQQRLNNTSAEVKELYALAKELLEFAQRGKFDLFQPGGSPAFQFILGNLASNSPIRIFYAHSERVSVEKTLPDGRVEKTSVFKHRGWICLGGRVTLQSDPHCNLPQVGEIQEYLGYRMKVTEVWGGYEGLPNEIILERAD